MLLAMDTGAAARAIEAVFQELRPHLPDGAGIQLSPRRKWTVVQRADSGSENVMGLFVHVDEQDVQTAPASQLSSAQFVRGLGPWVPFLPRRLRRRLTAQSTLDLLLRIFYDPQPEDGFHRSVQYSVKSSLGKNGITLSYTLPGSSSEVGLRPLPEALFK
jgi:hypothetical protein